MLVHRRSLPRNFVRFPQQIAGTHLYTWVERGTVRVKCLAQEHNTLSSARARTRTARSGVELNNHEATAPPLVTAVIYYYITTEFHYAKQVIFLTKIRVSKFRLKWTINVNPHT